jgi:hypothetical protein
MMPKTMLTSGISAVQPLYPAFATTGRNAMIVKSR